MFKCITIGFSLIALATANAHAASSYAVNNAGRKCISVASNTAENGGSPQHPAKLYKITFSNACNTTIEIKVYTNKGGDPIYQFIPPGGEHSVRCIDNYLDHCGGFSNWSEAH